MTQSFVNTLCENNIVLGMMLFVWLFVNDEVYVFVMDLFWVILPLWNCDEDLT